MSRTWVAESARRTLCLAGVLVILVVWNLWVRGETPTSARPWAGLALSLVLVLGAQWAALTADDLGLSRTKLGSGFRWGAAAFAVVTLAIIGFALIASSSGVFESSRTSVSESRMWFEVLITIPIGTVIPEELAFRGVLLGLLRSKMSSSAAVIACSLLFGLWHIQGVATSTAGSGTHVLAASFGTFCATFLAGIAFCWLRLRSGSLMASAMAHVATNSVALATAWFLAH